MNVACAKFSNLYEKYCRKHGLCQAKESKVYIGDGTLNINADRLKSDEWPPVIEALQESSDLRFVAIRRKEEPQKLDSANGKSRNGTVPSILEPNVRKKLCESLKWCLKLSTMLEFLVLENIPLKFNNATELRDGLLVNRSLRLLSLEKCSLGDKAFNEICMGIKSSGGLSSVNFSECNLTWKCVESLSTVIQCQDGLHHEETWKSSFRFQLPHLDEVEGLQEINLSRNPGVGDKGISMLAKVLTEDLWIKVLDLQHCGITDEGAQALLIMIGNKRTKTSIFLDNNPIQDEKLLEKFRNETNSVYSNKQLSSRLASKTFSTGSLIYYLDERGLRDNGYTMYRRGNTNSKRLISSEAEAKIIKENESLKNQLQRCKVLLEKEEAKSEKLEKVVHDLTLENEKLKYMQQNNGTKIDMDETVFNHLESTFKNFYSFLNLLKDMRLKEVQSPSESENNVVQETQNDPYDGYLGSHLETNHRQRVQQEWEMLNRNKTSQMKHIHIVPENYMSGPARMVPTTRENDFAHEGSSGQETNEPLLLENVTKLQKGILLPAPKSSSFLPLVTENRSKSEERDVSRRLHSKSTDAVNIHASVSSSQISNNKSDSYISSYSFSNDDF